MNRNRQNANVNQHPSDSPAVHGPLEHIESGADGCYSQLIKPPLSWEKLTGNK